MNLNWKLNTQNKHPSVFHSLALYDKCKQNALVLSWFYGSRAAHAVEYSNGNLFYSLNIFFFFGSIWNMIFFPQHFHSLQFNANKSERRAVRSVTQNRWQSLRSVAIGCLNAFLFNFRLWKLFTALFSIYSH